MRLSYTAEQFLLYIVCILIIAFLVLILRDIYHIIKKTKETKKRKKLSFDQYETIKSASLDDYIFYAPYGVSQSLIKFISEAPNFINAVADINHGAVAWIYDVVARKTNSKYVAIQGGDDLETFADKIDRIRINNKDSWEPRTPEDLD